MEKEMIKQREEKGVCSSFPESRKNSNEVQMKERSSESHPSPLEDGRVVTDFDKVKFCQSCGMPLTDDVLGTNADGSKNEDY